MRMWISARKFMSTPVWESGFETNIRNKGSL
jgi:hypothetical protein